MIEKRTKPLQPFLVAPVGGSTPNSLRRRGGHEGHECLGPRRRRCQGSQRGGVWSLSDWIMGTPNLQVRHPFVTPGGFFFWNWLPSPWITRSKKALLSCKKRTKKCVSSCCPCFCLQQKHPKRKCQIPPAISVGTLRRAPLLSRLHVRIVVPKRPSRAIQAVHFMSIACQGLRELSKSFSAPSCLGKELDNYPNLQLLASS